jgi:hypothetical protein
LEFRIVNVPIVVQKVSSKNVIYFRSHLLLIGVGYRYLVSEEEKPSDFVREKIDDIEECCKSILQTAIGADADHQIREFPVSGRPLAIQNPRRPDLPGTVALEPE